MSYKWCFFSTSQPLYLSSGRDRERRQQRLKMSFFNATTVRWSNTVRSRFWLPGHGRASIFWQVLDENSDSRNKFSTALDVLFFFLHQKLGFNTQHGPNGCQRHDRSIWQSKSSQRIPAKSSRPSWKTLCRVGCSKLVTTVRGPEISRGLRRWWMSWVSLNMMGELWVWINTY